MATNTNNWTVGETVRLPRAERLLKKGFSASYETFIDSRYICIREATDRQQGVLVKVLDKTHTEETEVVGGQLYTIDETDQLFDSYKYLCYQFPSAADVKEVLSILRGNESLLAKFEAEHMHINPASTFWVCETASKMVFLKKKQYVSGTDNSLHISGKDDIHYRISVVHFDRNGELFW